MAKQDKAQLLKSILPIGAILVSVILAAYWALLVPIFQSPNEDLHADYMFCIYSKKHLLQQSKLTKVTLAHSFTRYLWTATDGLLVKWNQFQTMPNSYGSKEFFQKLDSNAPAGTVSGCPNLIGTYPVGYYALNALWLILVSQFDSSLTVLFFAARFFSVFLFALGLVFSYLSLRELGLSYWRASLTMMAIGLMPLASFASSYIQPNNLSFAAISACFFFALRWRNDKTGACNAPLRSLPALDLWSLALALAILFLAKYQFYVCAAIAIIAMVIAKDWLIKRPAAEKCCHLAILFVPSLVAGLLQFWVFNGVWQYPANMLQTKTAIDTGLTAVKPELLKSTTDTLQSLYYTDGDCFRTFWHCFGWMDAPMIIGNQKLTYIFCHTIQWSNIIVILFTIISLVCIWFSLAKAWRKNHLRLAIFTAFSNPLLSAYFIYFIGVFSLAFLSYGKFFLQGRHWFPVILPIFWIATMLAPRFLPNKNWRKKISWLMLSALLVYSVIGNYSAIASIHKRYYETKTPPHIDLKNLLPVSTYASCAVEKFDYLNEVFAFGRHFNKPLSVPQKRPLVICGWAIDFPQHKPASAVLIYIDNKFIFPAIYGLESLKAVKTFKDEAYRYSGFGLIIQTSTFSPGLHTVNIKVVSNDQRLLYGTDQTEKFNINEH